MTQSESHVIRVGIYAMPDEARDEFLRQLLSKEDTLRAQPGFIEASVLEQSGGPGEFNFVTIAEWENQDDYENALETIGTRHERHNFDPQELFSRLGIEADFATYTQIDG
ncbi:antibiotic biosynthesis monooxygenase (plasmid) [Salinigranum rubrum]|uniref:Antibiotic biosynthesis monooxygenase n=1 Tax=Salinigranum rubrum TaxID=755307 RepID=A0A2I8VQ88_9EURY|nr:antibiotic biosynthesis monooxygenase family protein [Salinigranum rubrum]AUV84091.1 antibiotic biosynthesis monooxygenase [Salinigranum rubrum]